MPTTHTPGPWKHVVTTRTRGRIYGDGLLVATLDPPQLKEEVAMKAADARLIAAAPELLDVLTMALPYVEMAEHDDSYKPGVVAKMVQHMNDAIAKATGGAA